MRNVGAYERAGFGVCQPAREPAGIRSAVCENLAELGIAIDPAANAQARGEAPIHAAGSVVQVWIVPTNEEIIVARQARELLEGRS